MPNEGRESPPPETQSGAQASDPPSSGQGVGKMENKEQILKKQLENLESNPKGPMDDALKDKFAKSEK